MDDSPIHRVLQGCVAERPPFWLMRQAGRYLPEYRALRANVPDFLTLCYSPEKAAEVTLQPIRRFGMDAAIVFSDILVIPDALGQEVRFVKGEGPQLKSVTTRESIEVLQGNVTEHLKPVAETLKRVRRELSPETSLIGFCGAPWTVACYMVEGHGSRDFEKARAMAVGRPDDFAALIRKIVDASFAYLSMQVKAGADVLQIFDSWAGVLPEGEYRRWVMAPTLQLAEQLKAAFPHVPLIGFPRGSGALYATYAKEVPVDAVSLDTSVPLDWATGAIKKPLQGNLDPVTLASDKAVAVAETQRIIAAMKHHPFIFNLGHGILQWTPVDHVEAVRDVLRGRA